MNDLKLSIDGLYLLGEEKIYFTNEGKSYDLNEISFNQWIDIFKENTKKQFLIMSKKHSDISFLCIIYFLIIKILYYHIGIIDKHMYKDLKDFFWENNNGFNPIFINYDEYKNIYKKNYPNVKYMININL